MLKLKTGLKLFCKRTLFNKNYYVNRKKYTYIKDYKLK